MSAPCVIIVAPADDIHAEGVASLVARNGIQAVRIDSAAFPSAIDLCLTFPDHSKSYLRPPNGEKVLVRDVRALWWRRPRGPTIDPAVGDARQRDYAIINAQHAFEGFVSTLDCRVVNDIWAQRRAERKALQLKVADACGLLLPDTLMTNDPCPIQAILESRCAYIYKSFEKVAGAADGTKALRHDDMGRLEQLRLSPSIFQRFIEVGFDLRINYVNGKLFAAKVVSPLREARYDIRLDMFPHIAPYTLPPSLADKLRDLMSKLGLCFGTIDMRVDKQGNHFFLEVNPAGQWIYVEMQTHQPITQTLADYLCGTS